MIQLYYTFEILRTTIKTKKIKTLKKFYKIYKNCLKAQCFMFPMLSEEPWAAPTYVIFNSHAKHDTNRVQETAPLPLPSPGPLFQQLSQYSESFFFFFI